MHSPILEREALLLSASLQRSAARKRLYAALAARKNQQDAARLLRALAAAEEAQARRVFNNLVGKIDVSAGFLDAALVSELADSMAAVDSLLQAQNSSSPSRLSPLLRELRKAQLVMRSHADPAKGQGAGVGSWQVCRFCGYLAKEQAPDPCPVCGAEKHTFLEIS